MKELEILMNRRWVLKSDDRDLYYRLRDASGEIRKFATEKMGCQLIENALMIKLEKIPALPENFMGIRDFSSREEYAYLCVLLMFLEERDPQSQFILSQLTEYITANMPKEAVDWTLYGNRRKLIRVLRYAQGQGIIAVTDGSDDAFMERETGEVLYENTGASRYFMRNFSRDIMDYTKSEDLYESDWVAMDEDRGIARRHRVYNRLLFSVGMYRGEGADEDFEYLKYYGKRLAEDLEHNFRCRLHIHKESAFLMQSEECRMGETFPENTGLSDIILLCCGEIRRRVESREWTPENDDSLIVSEVEFRQLLLKVKREWGAGFIKRYREMTEKEFVREAENGMEGWTMIRRNRAERMVSIYPSAAKMAGSYPEDYVRGEE